MTDFFVKQEEKSFPDQRENTNKACGKRFLAKARKMYLLSGSIDRLINVFNARRCVIMHFTFFNLRIPKPQ